MAAETSGKLAEEESSSYETDQSGDEGNKAVSEKQSNKTSKESRSKKRKQDLLAAKAVRKSTRAAAKRRINALTTMLTDKKYTVDELEDELALLLQKEEELTLIDAKLELLISDYSEMEKHMDEAIIYREDITLLKSKINRIILKERAKTTNSNQSVASHSGSSGQQTIIIGHENAEVKLPPLPVVKFSGDYEKWNLFWGRFKATVDNKEKLSKVEKFYYLNSFLEGEALTAIEGLVESDESYDQAVQLLKLKYDKSHFAVHKYMAKLEQIQPVRYSGNVKALRQLLDTVEISIRSLNSLGVNTKEKASFVCPALLRCLPNDIRTDFFVKYKPSGNASEWDAEVLVSYIREQVECREMATMIGSRPDGSGRNDSPQTDRFSHDRHKNRNKIEKSVNPSASALATGVQHKPTDNIFCVFCNLDAHRTINCKKFTLDQKIAIIKDSKKCSICLRLHEEKNCWSKFRTCRRCQKTHNFAVCEQNPSHLKETKLSENKSVTMAAAPVKTIENSVLLQTAVAVVKHPYQNQSKQMARILLDGGSQVSFIKEELSRKLDLPVIGEQKLDVYSFGKTKPSQKISKRVKLTLENKEKPDQTVVIMAVEVPFVCHAFSSLDNVDLNSLMLPKNIQLADDKTMSNSNSEIDILIGADHYWEVTLEKTIRLGPALVALETTLGWCLQGVTPKINNGVSVNPVTSMLISVGQKQINDTLKTFWDLESIGIDSQELKQTPNDQTLETFNETIKHNGERFCVKFPWLVDRENLPDNIAVASKRMQGLVKKFQNDPLYYQQYKKVLTEQIDLGMVEVVSKEEIGMSKPGTYYIPHQGVVRENSATTKLRVVMDASSHAYGAPSLNDCLSPGPNMNPDLLLLLIRFRKNKVAVVADIEKAFLQVALDKRDRDSVRFLWVREEVGGEINGKDFVHLRMTRVPFGVTASPFLLAATIRYHAKIAQGVDDLTRKKVSEDTYVDDLCSGDESVEKAYHLSVGASKLMEKAGMRYRKWGTNSQKLRELWKGNTDTPFDMSETTGTKILGLRWDPLKDEFSFDLSTLIEILKTIKITKRQVLSYVSQIFDPLGLLAPFTVRAKMLLQTLWGAKLDWDEQLPEEYGNVFETWCQELAVLNTIKIHRHYFSDLEDEIESVELHAFCDASLKSYATAVYVRYQTKEGKVGVSLVTAKGRVAPLKLNESDPELTIPKLELMGCLLGARLISYVSDTFQDKLTESYLWSDSTIALAWLKEPAKNWRPFVANRAAEIHRLTKIENWAHCPGKVNPADLPTRGLSAKELASSTLWFEGPSWLKESKEHWPKFDLKGDKLDLINKERRKITTAVVNKAPTLGIQYLIDLDKHYYLDPVLRITAYLFRVANRAKGLPYESGPISAEEIERAEINWVKSIQAEEFPEELKALKNKREVNPTSKIATLHPILNEHGIICVGGRIQESDLSFREKHPIIITKNQRLAKLLTVRSHKQVYHGGINDTVVQLRERYWIPSARQLARTIVKDCITCKRVKAKTGDMPTAPLPQDRIQKSEPFSIVGIDFAGPVLVKNETKMNKTYICLTTCAVTRAIHLELIPSLSTEEFLLAFRRMVARRGVPETVWSDNALTFKKANKDLNNIWQTLQQERIKEFFGTKGIKWKYIIERSAWHGGWWEVLVKSTKNCLKKNLGMASLTYMELLTTLTETESIINSRPISYCYNDANEPTPLSPAEFLIGRRLTSLPPLCFNKKEFEHVPRSRRELCKRLKYREQVLDKIWRRWRENYIMELRSAHHAKTVKNASVLKVGDVVMIHEDNLPRHMWKLGLITDTIIGRDQKIRSYMVRTTKGNHIKRSIQHLCNLEISDVDTHAQ